MDSLLALKVETEAEGASPSDLIFYKHRALELKLPIHVKVGGVEARSDLDFMETLEVDGVIAPMVESAFGVEKFVEACHDRFAWTALTLESAVAFENRVDILNAARDCGISGVTIGRGDFAASLGLKGQEDSIPVTEKVVALAEIAQDLGLPVTIGGNMRADSIATLLAAKFPFNAVETRRFRLAPQMGTENSLWLSALGLALETEAQLLGQLSQKLRAKSQAAEDRIKLLAKRAVSGG